MYGRCFDPIDVPQLSLNANTAVLVLAILHSCPDLLWISMAMYFWYVVAKVLRN